LVRKQIIFTDKVPTKPHYSQATRVGDTLYLAGQVGRRLDWSFAAGDAEEQTRQALENMKAILEVAGTSLENVVKLTVYFRRREDMEKIRGVRKTYFPKEPPPSTLLQVAGFSEEPILVELDAIALVS